VTEADIDLLLDRARAAEAEGDLDCAIRELKRLVERVPSHAIAWAWLGNLLADREQFAEAEEAFHLAINADPNLAGAHSGLGRLFAALGQHRMAADAYERSILLQPTPSRFVLVADEYAALGDDQRADHALREALRLEADNEEALLNLALHLRPTDPGAALVLLRRAITIDPMDSVIARELGFELARAGELEEAHHFLETSVGLNPSDTWTHLYLANVYAVQGRKAEARIEHEAAVRCAPLSAYPVQQLAVFCESQGDIEEAREGFIQAVALDPSDAESAFLLGKHLFEHGSRDEGMEWVTRALQLDPNHIGALALRMDC
jgi:tetratricopeptide (TPR) repeat protein